MKEFYKNHRWVRIMVRVIVILLIILAIVFLFLRLWPAFGGRASKEDKKDYANRAENFIDGKFVNAGDFSIMKNPKGKTNGTVSDKGGKPKEDLPTKKPTFKEEPSVSDLTITWFGHSSMLIQIHGMNILIDPIFSQYASPVQFIGTKRFSNPSISVKDLPKIDIVLLSHDHYDHLDYNTILDIDDKVESYIVPLGVENHLERWGINSDKIQNMAWWEELEVNGLLIGCTPAKHYSNRSIDDLSKTLWASWVLKDENYQIFESGDTGFGDHFEQIHDKYGDFDLALLDSAQYDVRWSDVHMNPEEAYQAAEILQAAAAMPIHWGAFKLASHPWDDPAERIVLASEQGQIPIVTPMIGETMNLNNMDDYMTRWWRTLE
jgi:L-ascorbate metabolism protein UlaG (beta-lactamase superfamily)